LFSESTNQTVLGIIIGWLLILYSFVGILFAIYSLCLALWESIRSCTKKKRRPRELQVPLPSTARSQYQNEPTCAAAVNLASSSYNELSGQKRIAHDDPEVLQSYSHESNLPIKHSQKNRNQQTRPMNQIKPAKHIFMFQPLKANITSRKLGMRMTPHYRIASKPIQTNVIHHSDCTKTQQNSLLNFPPVSNRQSTERTGLLDSKSKQTTQEITTLSSLGNHFKLVDFSKGILLSSRKEARPTAANSLTKLPPAPK
jgi:hypothetical protein